MKIFCNKHPINAINRQIRHTKLFLIKKLPLISACLSIAICTCGHKTNAIIPGETFRPKDVEILHKDLTIRDFTEDRFQKAVEYYQRQKARSAEEAGMKITEAQKEAGRIIEEAGRKIEKAQRAFVEEIYKKPDMLLAVELQSENKNRFDRLMADRASTFIAKYIAEALSKIKSEPKERMPALIKMLNLFDAGRLGRVLERDPQKIVELSDNLGTIMRELSKTAQTPQEKREVINALSSVAKEISKAGAKDPAARELLNSFNLEITRALIEPRNPEPGAVGLAAEMGKEELSALTSRVSAAVSGIGGEPGKIYKNEASNATRPPQPGGYMEQMEHLFVDIFNTKKIDPSDIRDTLSSAIDDTIKKLKKINSTEAETAQQGLENFKKRLDLFMRLRRFEEHPERISLMSEISANTMRMALQDAHDFAFDPLVRRLSQEDVLKSLSEDAFKVLKEEVNKYTRQEGAPKELRKERGKYLKDITNERARRDKTGAKLKDLKDTNKKLNSPKVSSADKREMVEAQLKNLDSLSKLDPLEDLNSLDRTDLSKSMETLYEMEKSYPKEWGVKFEIYADGRTISLQEIYQNLFKNGFDKLKKNVPLTWDLVNGFMEGLEWFFGLFKSSREFDQDRLKKAQLLGDFLANLTKRLKGISDIPEEALKKYTQKIADYEKALKEQ